MSFNQASSKDFFERAGREARRYGADPWVFLRELVQNSRDACAADIEVRAFRQGTREVLVCRDNGNGMDRTAFESYFLRLYASSKEEDEGAIGFFGVGFWSVLLFDPLVVRVCSRSGETCNAFEINCRDFELNAVPATDLECGTEVVLYREARFATEAEYVSKVRERLGFFAQHVRPLPSGPAVNLYCEGQNLNRDFALPEQLGQRFNTRVFDGVIGFGKKPSVRVYKGGILVRDLVSLEEVIPSRKTKLPFSGWGFHPVISINIEGLKVLMDRQRVFEDPLLQEAVLFCEKKLLRLHNRLIRQLFPMNLRNRIFNLVDRFQTPKYVSWSLALLALLALFFFLPWKKALNLGAALAAESRTSTGPRADVASQVPIDLALSQWEGSVIDENRGPVMRWAFSYEGPDRLLFRIKTFARYDSKKGFELEPNKPRDKYQGITASGEVVWVEMGIFGGDEPLVLPVPPGYDLVEDSVVLGGGTPQVWESMYGEPLIQVSESSRVAYAVAPKPDQREPQPERAISPIRWPPAFRARLNQIQSLTVGEKVHALAQFIQQDFVYTQDASKANLFNSIGGPWLEKTLKTKAGDCDVLNGLLVLLIQSAGVPAQLNAGLVGENGGARSALHAWARYYDDGWKTMDITWNVAHHTTPGFESVTTAEQADPSSVPAAPLSVPAAEVSAGPTSPGVKAFPFLDWYALLLLLPLGVYLIYKKRGAIESVDESRYVGDLFFHYFHYGAEDGAFRLKFRPVFPTIGGHHLSLFEIQKLSNRGELLGASPGNRLLKRLNTDKWVLNRDSPTVDSLFQFLPSITWLEDLAVLGHTQPTHASLRAVAKVIRGIDPGFRIWQIIGSAEFREFQLPFRKKEWGVRHLLLGDEHPLYARVIRLVESDPEQGAFHGAFLILNKMTLYLGQMERFMERWSAHFEAKAKKGEP